jgi:hypothetical protein
MDDALNADPPSRKRVKAMPTAHEAEEAAGLEVRDACRRRPSAAASAAATRLRLDRRRCGGVGGAQRRRAASTGLGSAGGAVVHCEGCCSASCAPVASGVCPPRDESSTSAVYYAHKSLSAAVWLEMGACRPCGTWLRSVLHEAADETKTCGAAGVAVR